MSSRNRATLRSFFADGQLPTGRHFGDLVDSMMNMVDEGFRKTPAHGMEISTPIGHDALLSFYRDQRPESPLWTVRYAGDEDQLRVERQGYELPVLALNTRQEGSQPACVRVGINTCTPAAELDVAGVVRSRGRIGGLPLPGDTQPLADGRWHDITVPLSGCHAFEVMAGAGRQGGGQYALLYARAMNAFNPGLNWMDLFAGRKRIRRQDAWYGKRCDRLELRWDGSGGRDAQYTLQIRSRCPYGGDIPIRVQLTQLWFDPFMEER